MKNNKPVYLIAGGRWNNFEKILQSIFQLQGLKKPAVAYIGLANNDRKDFFFWAKTPLIAAGAEKVTHVNIGSVGWERSCEDCEVVFVSGGDVAVGMEALCRYQALRLIRRMYDHGKVFVGISAGSIMLAKAWLRWPDETDEKKVQLFGCLGLADIYCDAHDEPEWAELKTLLARLPAGARGLGLRSGSAVACRGDVIEIIAGKVDWF